MLSLHKLQLHCFFPHGIGIEQNLDDRRLSTLHFLESVLLSQEFRFIQRFRLEFLLLFLSFMPELFETFLLLHPIQRHKLKMTLDRQMLIFSEEKQAGLLLVNTGHHPLFVVDVVFNFLRLISETGYNHERILQVLSQYILVLVTLKHGIQIVELVVFGL